MSRTDRFPVAMRRAAGYISDAEVAADVAELADAQPSGGCDRKVVEVQLLSSAPIFRKMYEAAQSYCVL